MSTAADLLISSAQALEGTPQCVDCCASVVSAAVANSGVGPQMVGVSWSGSSNVPNIVGEFPAALRSTDLSSAQLGDLIVFGASAHLMIYAGNDQVVGNVTDATTNVTTVAQVDISKVSPAFSMVLHTGLSGATSNPSAVMGPGVSAGGPLAAVGTVAGDLFGTLFAWVPGFAVQAGILLVAAVLVFVGFKQLLAGAEDSV
jgi:hypothetical protein